MKNNFKHFKKSEKRFYSLGMIFVLRLYIMGRNPLPPPTPRTVFYLHPETISYFEKCLQIGETLLGPQFLKILISSFFKLSLSCSPLLYIAKRSQLSLSTFCLKISLEDPRIHEVCVHRLYHWREQSC